MINKIGMSMVGPSDEQRQIAKSNNLDWDRYVREIEDLKTNPPQMFEVTVPYFTWYHQTEFPAWFANSLTATGVAPESIPPTYDKKMIVTESYLEDLQQQVPGYLKDVTAIDPSSQNLSTPSANINTTTKNGAQPQQTTTTTTTTNTSLEETGSVAQTTNTSLEETGSVVQTAQSQSSQSSSSSAKKQSSESFDFTKLSPSLQETALRLAEQLLTAALQRLSGAVQTDAQLSTLFNRAT